MIHNHSTDVDLILGTDQPDTLNGIQLLSIIVHGVERSCHWPGRRGLIFVYS